MQVLGERDFHHLSCLHHHALSGSVAGQFQVLVLKKKIQYVKNEALAVYVCCLRYDRSVGSKK